jgi:hypothetical protein
MELEAVMPRNESGVHGSKGPSKQGHTGHAASLRELERQSGSAAAREALGRKDQEAAKRKTRYERGPTGQRGARSRGP